MVCWWRDLVISIPFFIYGIVMILEVWVILLGNTWRGPCNIKSRYCMKVLLGLPEVTVCVLPGLLFSSLYASFRWFLLGCPCVPYWAWSSHVFGLLSVRIFIPWSVFFIGVCSGFVASCALHLVLCGASCH